MPPKKTARTDGRFQEKLKIEGQPKLKYFYGKTQKEAKDKKKALDIPKPVEELSVKQRSSTRY